MNQLPQPTYRYLHNHTTLEAALTAAGAGRILSLQGRSALHLTSVHGACALGPHTLNAPQGSLTLWAFALEDLGVAAQYPAQRNRLKNAHLIPLLADGPGLNQNLEAAVFSLALERYWHPQFYAKWSRGHVYASFQPEQKVMLPASHFDMHKERWYQFALTWNAAQHDYRLYVNGIQVASADQAAPALKREEAQPTAYVGNPTLAHGEVCFYDRALSPEEVVALWAAGGHTDPALQAELEATYRRRPAPVQFALEGWRERLSLSLTHPQDLNHLRVQGNLEAPRITHEGLRITTPLVYYPHAEMPGLENRRHVYVFTQATFEGDLHAELAFKPLRRGGLALLMAHASGMQREDFLADYPPSSTDAMSYLYGEDVRNYHWEFWRDMNDTRNDVASHCLVKNPYFHPLGYSCLEHRHIENQWHTLVYHQEGGRITCAIDGGAVLEVEDAPFHNNGPIYSFGHFVLRCMINTDILFRDLRILTRSFWDSSGT